MSVVRKVLAVAVSLVLLLLVGVLVAGWWSSQPKFDEVLDGDPLHQLTIAPLSNALTFARTQSGPGFRVLLVTDANLGSVTGVDLADVFGQPFADPIEAFEALGFAALSEAATSAPSVSVAFDDLVLPFGPVFPHIAAGTNFQAHAEEVGLDDEPFLFPKMSHATAWNDAVAMGTRLDYEVELCAVTLTDHTSRAPAALGYVLCNDFTERWTLLRQIDLNAPMGTTGFPESKGGDHRLPIGALLVVPRDARTFYQDLKLALYVNGVLRQRAVAGLMIWSPQRVLSNALEACDVPYEYRGGAIGLVDCDGIPARTLVLTGTPAGVMFHPLNIWYGGAYLQVGDEVLTTATHLGVLRNRVR